MDSKEMSRFDTRISREQKEYFEYATRLGGFKTLSEFILSAAKSQAEQIISNHEQILASKRDRKQFFDALLHPAKPNAKLKKAASRYKQAAGK